MRMRRKTNLEARLVSCAHLLVEEPEALRGSWREAFDYEELHIELGCGKGRFITETAKSAPGVFFAALEKSTNVLVTALERANAQELRNVRFINALADNLAEYFAPGEVSRVYINFCDPWPANRRAKRRLTHRRFLEIYKQILRPGGEVFFKTDNLPLFDFSLGEFRDSGFLVEDVNRDLHKGGPTGVMTDYEIKFHSQGLAIAQCICTIMSNSGRQWHISHEKT